MVKGVQDHSRSLVHAKPPLDQVRLQDHGRREAWYPVTGLLSQLRFGSMVMVGAFGVKGATTGDLRVWDGPFGARKNWSAETLYVPNPRGVRLTL